jgi:hypothetical protein
MIRGFTPVPGHRPETPAKAQAIGNLFFAA